MAAFKDGIPNSGQAIPNYAQDFCLMNGGSQAGVVGMYPLDEQRCYYASLRDVARRQKF